MANPKSPIRVAVHGAGGRMGQRLVALAHADSSLQLVAALESADHPAAGSDAGVLAGVGDIGLPLSSELLPDVGVDAIVDFSVPDAAARITALCTERQIPLVLATTGFDTDQEEFIRDAAKSTPVVWAPNMSLAVNLVMKLCDIAAGVLAEHPCGVDVEIIERHHRYKEDAPSGTALKFGQVIADKMGQSSHRHGREGRPGVRPRSEIGFHAVRTGDNPGEHSIIFGLLGESIELRVAATNRDCYAQGGLVAAQWVAGKPPGLYTMNDVLGL